MLISTLSSPNSNIQELSQESQSLKKNEEEYNALIEHIGMLALKSSNPEDYYQEISILHFKNNRSREALQAVALAEEWATKKKTAPLSIYSALFHRAKHFLAFGNDSELKIAEKDLFNITSLSEVPLSDKLVFSKLYDNVVRAKKPSPKCESLYVENLKSLFKRNINYSPQCNENPENDICEAYNKAMKTYGFAYHNKDSIMADLAYKNAKPIFDKIVASEKSSKAMLEGSLLNRATINCHFRNFLFALEDLKKILQLNPDDDKAIKLQSAIEVELLEMNAKARLCWIDLALRSRINDPDLLLWKAEAHFNLNEIESGVDTAATLLHIIDKNHPHYEIVYRMTCSTYTKSNKS